MRRAETLRDQLEQDIVTGHFKPGERLDEQSLADRFGVSRTPIREALMQLASIGMVELHARRGAFVVSLSLKEVVERFETMASLGGMCGALAAQKSRMNSAAGCSRLIERAQRKRRTVPRIRTITPTSASTTRFMRPAITPISPSRPVSFTIA